MCSNGALKGCRLIRLASGLTPALPTRCPADGANRLVASAGEDGFIRAWDFRKRTLQAEIKVRAGLSSCQAAKSSQLKRLMRAARLHDAMPCLCLPILPHGPHHTPPSPMPFRLARWAPR